MDKYRTFLTDSERAEYDAVREQQRSHHAALEQLRPEYLRLGQLGRSRARSLLAEKGVERG